MIIKTNFTSNNKELDLKLLISKILNLEEIELVFIKSYSLKNNGLDNNDFNIVEYIIEVINRCEDNSENQYSLIIPKCCGNTQVVLTQNITEYSKLNRIVFHKKVIKNYNKDFDLTLFIINCLKNDFGKLCAVRNTECNCNIVDLYQINPFGLGIDYNHIREGFEMYIGLSTINLPTPLSDYEYQSTSNGVTTAWNAFSIFEPLIPNRINIHPTPSFVPNGSQITTCVRNITNNSIQSCVTQNIPLLDTIINKTPNEIVLEMSNINEGLNTPQSIYIFSRIQVRVRLTFNDLTTLTALIYWDMNTYPSYSVDNPLFNNYSISVTSSGNINGFGNISFNKINLINENVVKIEILNRDAISNFQSSIIYGFYITTSTPQDPVLTFKL